jgi:hypothetical protein
MVSFSRNRCNVGGLPIRTANITLFLSTMARKARKITTQFSSQWQALCKLISIPDSISYLMPIHQSAHFHSRSYSFPSQMIDPQVHSKPRHGDKIGPSPGSHEDPEWKEH